MAKNIVEAAKKRLGEIADFAAGFYLCGGGADVLPLKELLPGAVIVDNPQTANARAYLQLAMSEWANNVEGTLPGSCPGEGLKKRPANVRT